MQAFHQVEVCLRHWNVSIVWVSSQSFLSDQALWEGTSFHLGKLLLCLRDWMWNSSLIALLSWVSSRAVWHPMLHDNREGHLPWKSPLWSFWYHLTFEDAMSMLTAWHISLWCLKSLTRTVGSLAFQALVLWDYFSPKDHFAALLQRLTLIPLILNY